MTALMWFIVYGGIIALLAVGFTAGWLARGDHAEKVRLDEVEATVRGRHAKAWPRRMASTSELAALYQRPYPDMAARP